MVELKRVANGSGSELATVNDRAIRPIPVGRSSTTFWSAPGPELKNILRVRSQPGLGSSFGLESINTAAPNSPTLAEPNAVWSSA
jgi:hypothetical protein